MTARRLRVGAALFAALLLLVVAPPARADDLLSLTGGTKKAFSTIPARVSFPVGYATAARDPAAIRPTVIDVVRGDQALPYSAEMLGVELAVAAQALVVTVNEAGRPLFAPTGDYTVKILLTAGTNRQTVDLTLVRPATVVTAPTIVKVDERKGKRPPLRVTVGRDAGLTAVAGEQKEAEAGRVELYLDRTCEGTDVPKGAKGCSLAARTPVPLNPTAMPDGVLTLGYDLEEFPLGKSTRTVELRSPDIAAPISITFEVTKRRAAGWIVLITIAGVALGWVVRIGLTTLTTRTALSRRRADLIDQMASARGHFGDEELRMKLVQLEREAGTAKAATGLDDVETRAKAAVGAAEKRLDDLTTTHRALRAPVEASWKLPPGPAQDLTALTGLLQDAGQALQAYDHDTAKVLLADAGRQSDLLKSSVDGWLSAYQEALDTAVAGAAPAPTLEKSLVRAKTQATPAENPDVAALIKTADGSVEIWNRDLQEAILTEVRSRRPNDPQAATAVVKALSGTRADPKERLSAVTKDLTKLLAAPARTETREAAVRDAATGPTSTPTEAGEQVDSAAVLDYRKPAGWRETLRRDGARLVLGRLAELVRVFLLAVVLAVATYGIYADAWIGTATEMIALGGWAFGIDLTAEAVRTTFAKVPGSTTQTQAAAGTR